MGELDSLARNGRLRCAEVERRVVDIIERYERGEGGDVQIERYEVV